MKYAGEQVNQRFRSVYDAIAYSFSMMRGPQRRRMRWDDAPRIHGSPAMASMVRAVIRGDLSIQPGSIMWRQIEAVVFEGARATPKVKATIKRIRGRLGEAGLLNDQRPEPQRLDLEDVVFVDDFTGDEWTTVREERE